MTRKPETWTTCWSFFVAALKANPAAAAELMRKLLAEDRWMRLIGTAILTWGGYDTAALRETLSDEDKRQLNAHTMPDPYDLTPSASIGARQDMLLAIFFAT